MSKSDTQSIGGTDVPNDIDTTTTAGKLADLKRRVSEVANAGSERAVEKQHARGKKTARERLEMRSEERRCIYFPAVDDENRTRASLDHEVTLGLMPDWGGGVALARRSGQRPASRVGPGEGEAK